MTLACCCSSDLLTPVTDATDQMSMASSIASSPVEHDLPDVKHKQASRLQQTPLPSSGSPQAVQSSSSLDHKALRGRLHNTQSLPAGAHMASVW